MALKDVKKVLCALSKPIIEEFPLFMLTLVIASIEALRLLHGCIVAHYGLNVWIQAFRFISIATTISYLYAALTYYTKKRIIVSRIIRVICYAIPIILFITNTFLRLNFGLPLNPSYILILGETNTREASDFLSTFLLSKNGAITSVILLVICITCYVAEKYKPIFLKLTHKKWIGSSICCLSIPFLINGFYSISKITTIFQVNSLKQLDIWGWQNICNNASLTDVYTNLLYSFYAPRVAQKECHQAIKLTSNLTDTAKLNNDSLNVVLIIGESYIKYHSSLYGYNLNTTPNLLRESKSKHLFAFENINTPYNTTTLVIKNLLSCNSLGHHEGWQDNPYFPAIFKKDGYKVYFWDNQNGGNFTWDFTLNSFLHNKELSEVSYTAENKDTYKLDGGLIQSFLSQHFPTSQNNFTILHLWGQHVAAKTRYPHTAQFNHFTQDSITIKKPWLTSSMRQTIAEYDNATYYNDALIEQVINHYRKTNAVIVYLSDHGEETYDWRPSMGRNATPMCANVLKYQFDIPFVVWCSDIYQKKHPEIMKAIKASLHKPMSSDIICNMLFHLAGLKTKYYRPSLDILSKKYHCPKRIVLDKYNYDAIRFH